MMRKCLYPWCDKKIQPRFYLKPFCSNECRVRWKFYQDRLDRGPSYNRKAEDTEQEWIDRHCERSEFRAEDSIEARIREDKWSR